MFYKSILFEYTYIGLHDLQNLFSMHLSVCMYDYTMWVLHVCMCDIYLKCVIGLYEGNYEVALLYNESPIHVLLYILTQVVDQRTFICNQPGEV